MSLDRCLPGLERTGELDAGRSKEARELYNELRLFYERSHDPETAAALASQKTVERLEAAIAHKKRNAIRELAAKGKAIERIRTFNGGDPAATGPLDPRGAEALFGFDGRAGHSDTVEARMKAIKGRAHGMVEGILSKHHQNLIGNIRGKAELDDLVDETFAPGSTKNANASELSGAFAQAAEYLRARFNAAGGAIGKLANWFPQSHSALAIRTAGYNAWRDFITPLLDRGKIIDRLTGEPFTDQSFEPFLRGVWETLRTDGWSQVTEGAAGGKMLANQRADHRILHFKDGPSWRAYNQEFGGAGAFDAMMGHIEGMSRDIALMEILGPNPAATVRWLQDALVKSAQIDASPGSKAIAIATKHAPKIQAMYDELTGALRRPESERIALFFSTFRSIQTSAKLGSAILSALPTDPAFGAVTRAFNGIPMRKMFLSYAKQLNPASAADRKFAIRAGLIAEEWSHMTATSYRFLNEEMTGEVARRLSSGVLRASGLSWFTQAGRWAFGMDLLGHVTDQVSHDFDALPKLFRAALKRHGIFADDWDVIRHSPIEEHKGVGWILPKNIDDARIGDKLLQMIHTEVDYAVPMPDLRTRAFMNRVGKRGTIPGELVRSAFLFKGFGIGVILSHGRRIVQQAAPTALGYATALFALTTLGGAIALELKDIDKGKDARPVPGRKATKLEHAQFWAAASLQGGGWGIFGDFTNSSQNRLGGGFGTTLAGPQAQTGQNIGLLAGDSLRAAFGDKKANPGRDVMTLIKQETPGSSLWYSRLAFERLVADQLQEEIDPKYRQSWRAMKRRAAGQGQEFYWEPGETSPKRAPDLRALKPGGGDQ